MNILRVLVLGGGDVGSAVAHRLFRQGCQVLISEKPRSPHARRGMAFTDVLFDGHAVLDGIEGRLQADIASVEAQWRLAEAIPVVTIDEGRILAALHFDAVVDATMRRMAVRSDLRPLARFSIGLGPGYSPGVNCTVAVETQWGAAMGQLLVDHPAADRSGGPRELAGVKHQRFAVAPVAGTWHTTLRLGQQVNAGDPLGQIDDHVVCANITGCLRGLAWDGVDVPEGQRLAEVDPRDSPQVFGLGERPQAIAEGVVQALAMVPVASLSSA